ncbi:MAG: hypothetical protein M3044_09885 [Thermoproteota archaeon]|nr:hypothetical protein [Thermoproteota archaeon]
MNLLFLAALIPVLIVLVTTMKATAETANVTSIMGLNAQNIQNYEFNLGRITDIAKLHNATSATLGTFAAQRQVLTCVQLYFSQTEIADCNDLLTGYLTQNELGNNQTMINIAKAYLKLSGIQ